MTRGGRRLVRVVANVGAVVAISIGSAATAPAFDRSGIPVGEWLGTLTIDGRASVPGAGSNTTSGHGRLTVSSRPEGLDGLWELTAKARLQAAPELGLPPALSDTIAHAFLSGPVALAEGQPSLIPEGVRLELEGLGTLDVGPEYQLLWKLDITAQGCTQVNGVFSNAIAAEAPANGVDIASLSGPFRLTRESSLPGGASAAFQAEGARIAAELAALIASLPERGALGGLPRLLEQAEALGSQRRVQETCTTVGRVEHLLFGEVAALLDRYVGGDLALSGSDVHALVVASYRTGVLGPSSLDPPGAGERSARLRRVLGDQIDAHSGDRVERISLGNAARAAGFHDLARSAYRP